PAISKGFEDLVPAFGFPPSDILQTTGLDANNPLGPAIATGRIPASDNASVLNYLEKVKEHEMLPIEKWRKNIIHISGGNTEQEGKSLKTKMDSWKEMAEGIYFGGHVKHFAKLSNTLKPIDDVFKQEIAQEVNKGASYLTYFGHSTAAATEVDFGKPTEVTNGYANTGKYPFMYMNGCHISNSFGINSFSQDWLLSPGKGAIAYLGHVNFGFTEEFNVYGQAFYRRNFQDPVFQNKSIGATQIQVIKDYFEVSGIFAVTQAHAAQMMLQGDPSLKIFKPQLPDYKFESAYIRSFTGRPVTATSDSFQVAIAVSNLGLVKKDSFSIAIIRTVVEQNKTFTQHPQVFPAVYFEDTLYFTMRSTDKNTFGINTFEIRLDPKDSIAELSELNNTGTIQLFMPASAVNPLFPKEFSIVSSSQVELVAQSTDLMSDSRQYIFEIDTTYLFNSPFKKLVEQTSPALVKSGKLSLLTGLANDSMVYFWRVRYKDVAGEEIIWGESSFIVINGSKPGWSQAKFSQFLKNNIDKGFIDVNKERIQFKSTTNTIFVQVMGEKLATPSNPKNFNFKFNNSSLIENGDGKCGQWGIGAVCINNITGDFYLPAGTKTYCQYGYKDVRPLAFFPFNSSDTSIGTQLINYIKGVPTDYYVLLFNIGNANFHKWSPLLKSTIKSSFKATLADSLKQGSGYILWAQKNTKIGPIAEKVALPLGSVSVNTTFNIAEPFTQMKSTLIGPSNEWGTIYRKYKEVQSSDKFVFQLLGVNYAGKETFLKTISKDTFSISDISAKDYPYLRLVASISDTANRTAINLYEWQVIYNGIPEGTLNLGIAGKELYKGISKNEGDNIDLAFAFENISQFPFVDTLKARVRITDSKNQNKDTLVTLRKLAPGEVVNFTYKGNTKGFDSKNTIQLFVNPYLQAEEYYNNNIIEIPVTVNLDKTSPIVDVAIDGVHILNGDIVSPSPLINIRMNDENRYLTYEGIKDTSLVKIYLAGPCSYCSSTIPLKLYGNADVRYIGKGEGSGNNLVIDYNPQKLPDGKYTLTVSGKDLSGNNTQKPYQITFEVINKSSITYFYPYPNPFSTSTRFVFTLTGSEIPEDLKIQIMTVTGKVVREITKSELGPLRIGNNISQYAWDGFDEYGDKLANGVYLYRVIIKNPGDNFQRRETSADKAFKKEFGKLYILR
ncbi:MAG TPA: C25 family cysteine peptidase, partial [Cytophagaceae bacterium]